MLLRRSSLRWFGSGQKCASWVFSVVGAVWVMDHYTYQSRSTIAHIGLVYMLAEENGGLAHGFGVGGIFYIF